MEQQATTLITDLVAAASEEDAAHAAARAQLVEQKHIFASVAARCAAVLVNLRKRVDAMPTLAQELDAAETSTRAPRTQRDAFEAILKVISRLPRRNRTMCVSFVPCVLSTETLFSTSTPISVTPRTHRVAPYPVRQESSALTIASTYRSTVLPLQDAADPTALKRIQMKLKQLRWRLDEGIDDEIEVGDATLEDKVALQAEVDDIADGDKKRRRALRGMAVLAAQELPELEIKYPNAMSLERWGHLPRREFGDYTSVIALLPGACRSNLWKASLDGRDVVLKGHTHIAGMKQLEREIEALKVLQHPNIVAALGVCRQQTSSGKRVHVSAYVCVLFVLATSMRSCV